MSRKNRIFKDDSSAVYNSGKEEEDFHSIHLIRSYYVGTGKDEHIVKLHLAQSL